MKSWLASLTLFSAVLLSACGDSQPNPTLERSRQIPEWFDDAKFGIFIHWGPYSVPAFGVPDAAMGTPEGFEKMTKEGIAPDDYNYAEWYRLAMESPQGKTRDYHAENFGAETPYEAFQDMFESQLEERWDPEAWADLFAASGAEYVVFVTKHHDGYSLWPTEVPHPYIPGWNSSRDLVGELATAVRDRGMRFGVYYSTGYDWSFKLDYYDNTYEQFYRNVPNTQEYGDYVYAQMRELIDRYQPDTLWPDINYPDQGRRDELLDYYFEVVPEGVTNDRWEHWGVLADAIKIPGVTWLFAKMSESMLEEGMYSAEDDPERYGYKTAEYFAFEETPTFKWEATRGIGKSFAYNTQETEEDMLTTTEVVTYLIDTVSKNGNVLLNVGPDAYGVIPPMQQAPLLGLGKWLDVNGESIYGTRPWKQHRATSESGLELRFTQTDDHVYVTVLGQPGADLSITLPELTASSATLLGYGEVPVEAVESSLKFNLSHYELDESPAYVLRVPKTRG